MMVDRYFKTAEIYRDDFKNEELIKKINDTLNQKTEVEMTTKLDTDSLSKIDFYYNFASYSISACLIYVVCMIINSFKEEKIRKRTIISSVNYKKYNRELLLSNCLFSIFLWGAYVLISFAIIGKQMASLHGILFMINALIFTICSTVVAFLIGNWILNKNAITGLVNVYSLGSSFLCGVFVPMEMLPEWVKNVAHILPTYYYVESNDKLSKLETINIETLKPVLTNIGIIIGFTIIFIILTNIISKKKSKI